MGTNYYHKRKGKKKRHIGKSSGGWCFSLHVIPEKGIESLEDWKKKLEKGKIVNEYGDTISLEEMLVIITERHWKRPLGEGPPPFMYASWQQFFRQNHAEIGPNNLLRHTVDGRHCVGQGDGTWDLIAGTFS
jgi:hypothetical protein